MTIAMSQKEEVLNYNNIRSKSSILASRISQDESVPPLDVPCSCHIVSTEPSTTVSFTSPSRADTSSAMLSRGHFRSAFKGPPPPLTQYISITSAN